MVVVPDPSVRPVVPERRGGRWRWTFGAPLWLIFYVPEIGAVWSTDAGRAAQVLGLLATVGFVVLYVVGPPLVLTLPWNDWRRPGLVALAGLLSLGAFPAAGADGMTAFPFIAVLAFVVLQTRPAVWITGGLMGLAVLLTYTVPGWDQDPGPLVFSIALAALAAFGFTNLIRRNVQLQQARDELARLAVTEERERFARDLHDVLGHSLTVITVKSELAQRLVSRDPVRAEAEVADIERLAREALADVRATVAGYREANLAREISTARPALEAAGIEAELPHALDAVEGERREAYAWVVREGITNVLRHSGARHVLVRVDKDCVEVRDDGRGAPSADLASAGHGLTGLAERIAAAGGRLHAGSLPDGGFRLAAEFGEPT